MIYGGEVQVEHHRLNGSEDVHDKQIISGGWASKAQPTIGRLDTPTL